MDSMRSLNTSLPSSLPPSLAQPKPPEQLLQAFKTAALSVTNLYKTAASDQARAKLAGYQEALDELLQFLDREDLGLGDGEGWKVRRWATERLDGALPAPTTSDSDDEGDDDKRPRSSSPLLQPRPSQVIPHTTQPAKADLPMRTESAPPMTRESPKRTILIQETETIPARHDMFNFQSPHASPASGDVAMGSAEHAPDTLPNPMPSVRGDAHPRQSRNISRHSSQNARANTRTSTSLGSLGAGAGSKRRIAFGDFFDVSGLSNDRERHGGGGKRTRFT